jgi:hypothetical protein
MSPQLSVQQLEHAIKNLEALIGAKKLEIDALSKFRELVPGTVSLIYRGIHTEPTEPQPLLEFWDWWTKDVQRAAENFFTAKINQALVQLEEIEMQLKAVKHMRAQQSGILIPNLNFKS